MDGLTHTKQLLNLLCIVYKQMIYEIHCVSLPIILIKIKVDQILPSSYISSLLIYTYFKMYCHKLRQWGWVTSSRNISYDPSPAYADQSKHVNMAINHIFKYKVK